MTPTVHLLLRYVPGTTCLVQCELTIDTMSGHGVLTVRAHHQRDATPFALPYGCRYGIGAKLLEHVMYGFGRAVIRAAVSVDQQVSVSWDEERTVGWVEIPDREDGILNAVMTIAVRSVTDWVVDGRLGLTTHERAGIVEW